MVLVKIPAGTFLMGSPEGERGREVLENETPHQVTLTEDYYIGKTEVTQQQWEAVMGEPMSGDCGDAGVGDNLPVYCVSWEGVADEGGFMEQLNTYFETTAFHLPSEAQWERAARAGTSTRFSHGDVLECDDLCSECSTHDFYMWSCQNSGIDVQPVGLKQPNLYGLHDVHGNVWEWVQDRYGDYSTDPLIDPTGPGVGNDRVIRSGDRTEVAFLRSAIRAAANPGVIGANQGIGFRVAASAIDGLAIRMNSGLNGNWWNANRSGEGAQVEVSAGANDSLILVATVYSYDIQGKQIFLIAVGAAEGNTAAVTVFITQGGRWGLDFNPNLVEENQWGTGTFTVHSCGSMTMELNPAEDYWDVGYSDVMFDLVRLTTPSGSCPVDR